MENDIKAALKAKFDEWLRSISDPRIKELIRNNTILTGGAIVSLYDGEKAKDFDIYFTNKEALLEVTLYYANRYNKKHRNKVLVVDGDRLPDVSLFKVSIQKKILAVKPGVVKVVRIGYPASAVKPSRNEEEIDFGYDWFRRDQMIEGNDYGDYDRDEGDSRDPTPVMARPVEVKVETPKLAPVPESARECQFNPKFMSANAVNLTGKVQVITRFYGTPDQIHENFDFVHCTNYYVPKDDNLVMREEAVKAIEEKKLSYVGSKYPICSVLRAEKFIDRGWDLDASEAEKIMQQVLDLDLINQIQDQLEGFYNPPVKSVLKLLNKFKKNPGAHTYGDLVTQLKNFL